MDIPNRWLHLRHPEGFDDASYTLFQAHCRVWRAYVQAVLADWSTLQPSSSVAPRYVFFPPTLSADRTVLTLPVGGDYLLGARAIFEDDASRMLSGFFPLALRLRMEEGLTETLSATQGARTSWRPLIPRGT